MSKLVNSILGSFIVLTIVACSDSGPRSSPRQDPPAEPVGKPEEEGAPTPDSTCPAKIKSFKTFYTILNNNWQPNSKWDAEQRELSFGRTIYQTLDSFPDTELKNYISDTKNLASFFSLSWKVNNLIPYEKLNQTEVEKFLKCK